MELTVIPVPTASVPQVLPEAMPWLEKFFDRESDYSVEDLLPLLTEGARELWLVLEGSSLSAVVVTQIYDCFDKKECLICHIGGEGMDRWLRPGLEVLEANALDRGCWKMRVCGRKGWQKVLNDYTQKEILLEKELCQEQS